MGFSFVFGFDFFLSLSLFVLSIFVFFIFFFSFHFNFFSVVVVRYVVAFGYGILNCCLPAAHTWPVWHRYTGGVRTHMHTHFMNVALPEQQCSLRCCGQSAGWSKPFSLHWHTDGCDVMCVWCMKRTLSYCCMRASVCVRARNICTLYSYNAFHFIPCTHHTSIKTMDFSGGVQESVVRVLVSFFFFISVFGWNMHSHTREAHREFRNGYAMQEWPEVTVLPSTKPIIR